MYNFKKYFITAIAIFVVFTSGFVAGCINKGQLATEAKIARHTSVMPNDLKGIHTFQSVGSVDVAFSPQGGITNMIVSELNKAKQCIQVQAYSFTSPEIINALIEAKKRGVDVRIIIDKSNVNGEDSNNPKSQKEKNLLKSVVDNGIPMKVDSGFQIAHSKIMIIDGIDVITGSFNFTYSAEHNNAENCLILHGNKQLADKYMKNWQWRWNATNLYK